MNNNFDYSDYQDEVPTKKIYFNEENKDLNGKNNKNVNSTNKRNLIISIVLIFIIISLIGVVIAVKMNNSDNDNLDNNTNNNDNDIGEVDDNTNKEVSIIDVNSKTRPYAVMINCHNGALPQAGLQNAYVVYEIMVEAGITRMMALFKDKDIEKIGSVRSARTQYLDYVYENDAIYVHAGGAKDALNRISQEGIADIDVDGAYGFRDTSLKRSWEHTLFTSTNLLSNAIKNKSIRTNTDVGNLLTYQANPLNLNNYSNLKTANNISIRYSDYRTSNYVYDSSKKVYLRSMNDKKNTDLVTGEQYEVKNIIVYPVKYSSYTYNNYSLYQKIDNVGTGDGYYITEGKAIPITWNKTSKNSKTKYVVKETGKELVVNDGNTYIQIYPTSGNLKIS